MTAYSDLFQDVDDPYYFTKYVTGGARKFGNYAAEAAKNVVDDFKSDPIRTAGQFTNWLSAAHYLYRRVNPYQAYPKMYFPDEFWRSYRSPWSYRNSMRMKKPRRGRFAHLKFRKRRIWHRRNYGRSFY